MPVLRRICSRIFSGDRALVAQLDSVNRLSCPEVTGHTSQDGIVSYAMRQPGERLWQGVALKGIDGTITPDRYRKPADAITAAVARLTGHAPVKGGK